MSNHSQIDRFKKRTEKETIARFAEVWHKAHPEEGAFDVKFGKHIWHWMETYSRIKSHDQAEILDAVALAYGQCVSQKNKQIRDLEQKIVVLKAEVTKLQCPHHPARKAELQGGAASEEWVAGEDALAGDRQPRTKEPQQICGVDWLLGGTERQTCPLPMGHEGPHKGVPKWVAASDCAHEPEAQPRWLVIYGELRRAHRHIKMALGHYESLNAYQQNALDAAHSTMYLAEGAFASEPADDDEELAQRTWWKKAPLPQPPGSSPKEGK